MSNVFEKFTNQYSLSKTLRFELKPVGNTQKMLDDIGVFRQDEIRKEKYEQIKPFFDELHRDFIKECLDDKKISENNLNIYFNKLKELEKDKKNKNLKKELENISKDLKKELENISKDLRKELNEYFVKNELFGKLFGTEVFDELKNKYGNEEKSFLKDENGQYILDKNRNKISIFDEWKNFTGYFTKFHETRKNFYKDDGTETSITTRMIDQNLKRFCDNLQLFDEIKNKIDFSKIESDFSFKLNEFFSLNYYNYCLLQDGIDEYNKILGGEIKENGDKIKGLNEIINEYRQKNLEYKKGYFKLLDKQILSEKKEFIESIKDDEELLEYLNKFYNSVEEKIKNLESLLDDFFNNLDNYDLEKVYISKDALNTILYKWMSENGRIEFQKNALGLYKKEKIVTYNKDNEEYKFPDFISFDLIQKVLNTNFETKIWKEKYFISENNKNGCITEDQLKFEQFIFIFKYEFNCLFENEYKEIVNEKDTEIKIGLNLYKNDFKKIISKDPKVFSVSSEEKLIIKNFVDNVLWVYQMGKYFALEKKRNWIGDDYKTDSNFYDNSEYGFKGKFYDNAYEEIIKVRMLIQSYLTKKPFNTNKWKLNFECSHLLGGWSSEFNTFASLIFKKDNKYYLGVINGKNLDKEKRQKLTKEITKENTCLKMIYDFQKPDNKNVPRLFIRSKGENFAPAVKELNLPIKSVLEIYDKGLFKTENKKDPAFKISLEKIIDYFKLGFTKHPSYKHFDFKWKDSSKYKNIADFYKDTIRSCYQLKWEELNFDEVKKLSENGSLYLFQIYNKDFSDKSNGLKNLHSLYFQSLFISENLKNEDGVILKLSGGGEIFYRPKTKDLKKEEIITKKRKQKINEYNHKEEKAFQKNRFTENKIFLHFPIELNYTLLQNKNFNTQVNEFLVNNSDINIIGIDRGEKHLIYYAGIDQKGNLLKDKEGKIVLGSLNKIDGVDYNKLLEDRAKGREKAKQDWQNIEGIKDLKKGYISLVVRKLADLMIEHNAIIVLEDLNMRFKQIRGGIEKSVYQQLEKALIDKLNFLVNKGEKDPQKAGSLLKAYQLTEPFTTFKDMGKQTGMIFYTQASYTSKTCPVCGFRPNVNWGKEEILDKVNFGYKDDNFIISYNLKDINNNKNKSNRKNILFKEKNIKDNFELKTKNSIRYKWFARNKEELKWLEGKGMEKIPEETGKGITFEFDINKCLKTLFERENIDYTKDIQKEIKEKVKTKKFYKDLSYLLYLLSNTRNSISGKDFDLITCPCCGFNSEEGFQGNDFNGDANGAYNIARKGILILEKLKQFKEDNKTLEKMDWGDLFIDIEEWDKFTQK